MRCCGKYGSIYFYLYIYIYFIDLLLLNTSQTALELSRKYGSFMLQHLTISPNVVTFGLNTSGSNVSTFGFCQRVCDRRFRGAGVYFRFDLVALE